jgi:hypothetical protein
MTDPAVEESVKFVLRSLPPDHGVSEDDIRRRLQRGDAWETVVDDLVAEVGAEEEDVEVDAVETKLDKEDAAPGWRVDAAPGTHLAWRDNDESAPSPTGSHATCTPTGSADGRKIKAMGRPRLEGKAARTRRVAGSAESGPAQDDDDGYETSSLDSFGASQGSRTGSTISLGGGSDGSGSTGSTCPLGDVAASTSTALPSVPSPARPTHGRKRQLTSVSANDQSSRRITRSRNGGTLPGSPARKTFSVLGKNMAKVRDPAVTSTSEALNADDQVLRGKAKREARKRRAEIGRRERIEAEAWGLGADEPAQDGQGEGRRTRGGAAKKEEGEGAIKGIKELYI